MRAARRRLGWHSGGNTDASPEAAGAGSGVVPCPWSTSTLPREQHPYDVPEVVAIPFVGGSDKYISWLVDNVTPSARAAADGGGEREEGTQ